MKKNTAAALSLLALLALTGVGNATAQPGYDSDRRYCSSGVSGVDFNSCMWQIQQQRQGYDNRNGYDRRGDGYRDDRRGYDPRGGYDDRQQGWGAPPPPRYEPQWRQPERRQEQPRLSDVQRRVLNNCDALPYKDQGRCRAAVMQTVPR